MSDFNSIGARLSNHVLGSGSPFDEMEKSGLLSHEWTIKVIQLCKEANQICDGQPTLPRDIVAPIFFATTPDFRDWYDCWSTLHRGRINEQTQINLATAIMASSFFTFG